MKNGKIKFTLVNDKGYAFITDTDGVDFFAHVAQNPALKDLAKDAEVTFELGQAKDKRTVAINVTAR